MQCCTLYSIQISINKQHTALLSTLYVLNSRGTIGRTSLPPPSTNSGGRPCYDIIKNVPLSYDAWQCWGINPFRPITPWVRSPDDGAIGWWRSDIGSHPMIPAPGYARGGSPDDDPSPEKISPRSVYRRPVSVRPSRRRCQSYLYRTDDVPGGFDDHRACRGEQVW